MKYNSNIHNLINKKHNFSNSLYFTDNDGHKKEQQIKKIFKSNL